jgi:hypothetical protein
VWDKFFKIRWEPSSFPRLLDLECLIDELRQVIHDGSVSDGEVCACFLGGGEQILGIFRGKGDDGEMSGGLVRPQRANGSAKVSRGGQVDK